MDSGRIGGSSQQFIAKDAAGAVERVAAEAVGAPDFNGASTDIIDDEDVALVADSINAGGVGVVLVYEDLTLLPVLNAWQAEGATVISEGPVIVDDLIDALDATAKASEDHAMGLLRTATKVAVASSVHGRVQRRQHERWSQQDAQAAQSRAGKRLRLPQFKPQHRHLSPHRQPRMLWSASRPTCRVA